MWVDTKFLFPTQTSLLNSRMVYLTDSFTSLSYAPNWIPDHSLNCCLNSPSHFSWWQCLPGCQPQPPLCFWSPPMATAVYVLPGIQWQALLRPGLRECIWLICLRPPRNSCFTVLTIQQTRIISLLQFFTFSLSAFYALSWVELCLPKRYVEVSTHQYLKMCLYLEIGLWQIWLTKVRWGLPGEGWPFNPIQLTALSRRQRHTRRNTMCGQRQRWKMYTYKSRNTQDC